MASPTINPSDKSCQSSARKSLLEIVPMLRDTLKLVPTQKMATFKPTVANSYLSEQKG